MSVKIIVDSITDYIAMPKESGYRAIHIIILGLYPGQFVELQILTKAMDRIQIGNFHSQI